MAHSTICVPAYRAARFLPQTLSSLAAQTERDFIVHVAIEPIDADLTLDACRAYTTDPRFRFKVNPAVLGWDGNIRELLRSIETPYFAILPHDDLWHPEYLATLHAVLSSRPDATVAYADMFIFGKQSGVRGFKLPDADLGERLLAFFLGGAEGPPWRGLSRASVLDRSFPGNEFSGFAIEAEWALHLITRGVALHVERPLYLKRGRIDDASVSAGWRFRMPEDELRRAVEHHRTQLLAAVANASLDESTRANVELAAEAAMIRRWVVFSAGRFEFDEQQRARYETIVTRCRDDPRLVASWILGLAYLAMALDLLQRRELAPALEYTRKAAALAPDDPATLFQLARVLMARQRIMDALPVLYDAARADPLGIGVAALQEVTGSRMNRMFPFETDDSE